MDASTHPHHTGLIIYIPKNQFQDPAFPLQPGQTLRLTINPDQSITLHPSPDEETQ